MVFEETVLGDTVNCGSGFLLLRLVIKLKNKKFKNSRDLS
ncbi:hypothetical protein MmTuc01_2982 [Methanosarcina mazei Tuc01]|jgi:hypothetical protein|uniref:Uncharacterized protein n=1 Tax=Methanosarcina mazei Tuc01 TaxID=1236903 RepID=M1Q0Z7_METMZ|nr:hypothetical protein MmTuc01_2982 [Methanosarcina mazei Tuc01]